MIVQTRKYSSPKTERIWGNGAYFHFAWPGRQQCPVRQTGRKYEQQFGVEL